jgi:flagella basal body P-ring formation protein FlgA
LVEPSQAESRPVIRAGESLIVEEHTSLVDARLEAVALGSALAGSAITVRLKIGGRVVRAVALAPGRAELQPQAEARP